VDHDLVRELDDDLGAADRASRASRLETLSHGQIKYPLSIEIVKITYRAV